MPAQLADALEFNNGATLKNRFVLAPLTNLQSAADGVLSDDEYRWLTYRAEGGFGLTMTCAASVQHSGVGFPGQLGAHDDRHIPGLTRLAARGDVGQGQLRVSRSTAATRWFSSSIAACGPSRITVTACPSARRMMRKPAPRP